jgi:cell division protein FtsW
LAEATQARLRLVPEARVRPDARSARRDLALMLAATATLTTIGLLEVLSASSVDATVSYGSSFWFFNRQSIYALIGVAALLFCWRLDHTWWKKAAAPMMAITVALLALALEVGASAYGASRWLVVGPFTLQPSELAKFSLVVFTAAVMARKAKHLDEPAHLALPLAPVVALVAGIVILQRDLGTTVILCGSVFILMFAAGVRLRYLGLTAAVGLALSAILVLGESYRRERLLAFLHPFQQAGSAGYQQVQGLLSLGAGGWTGVGLGRSAGKWLYVPNAHTDFIFAILGEELGLIGEIVTLALFATLLIAGVRIALRARDPFGRLLAAGIVGWIGLQTLVNLGAVTGLLPVTGVPLPLVSFGGSSLIVTLAGIGVLASIARDTARAGRAS